ncbi:LysR family transcriptional regulator [Phreatobacter sp. AB_2022a]|uniref:LysR family transcriptional regulator n=1 Tax=Phreatobacter sp. AB_2022a TaxID=3003134 RepID=UPI0022873DB8|nr:LysR family transcriptional regulator [Phreatobacter sp. AB_2022a]MCZ0735108.1 LysR family transcriptional regulator [Phreatobacter sp. AB_2022a]
MLSEMRAFVLLAETGSIQLTAERLPLTQPAVTRQIQRLEAELGTVLLDRRSKPPRLTPAGLAALDRCRAILGAVGDLKASASADAEPQGVLRIGAATALSCEVIIDAVQMIRGRFPKVALRFVGGWAHDLRDQVQAGRLDAAVVLGAAGLSERLAGLHVRKVAQEDMRVVAGSGAHLSRRPGLAELGDNDWVLSPLPCDARHVLASALSGAGRAVRLAAEIQGLELQTALIGQNLGLGLVPARRLAPYARRNRLKVVDAPEARFAFDIALVSAPHLGRLDSVVEALGDRLAAVLAPRPPAA